MYYNIAVQCYYNHCWVRVKGQICASAHVAKQTKGPLFLEMVTPFGRCPALLVRQQRDYRCLEDEHSMLSEKEFRRIENAKLAP